MFYRAIPTFLLLASLRPAWAHPEHLQRRNAAPEPAPVPNPVLQVRAVTINTFDYIPTNGPLTWHEAHNNLKCKEGRHQSPILLGSGFHQTAVGALTYTGGETEGELENRGSAIEVVHAVGSVSFGGSTYTLDSLHLHTPSEHRVNEEYYPVEMHMVHRNSAGKSIVLGFLFQLSTSTSSGFVRAALANINRVASPGTSTPTGPLNLEEIVEYVRTKHFYEYSGSLTTPPCTEGITWMVGTEPLSLDVNTYNSLKATVKYNSRITQSAPGQ